ncbi:MAG TPA: alpha/beta hydrolase, partial [Flavobacterium alvei]|nr:alpha/beta hydrolase [Flavobacterium alvei]
GKNYPKSMLSDYELGLMYEKNGDAKRAAKSYQKASQLEEIGDLTKDMMMEKFDEMQSLTTKK